MSSEDVKKLCTRLLNGHGGVGLGKSLLTSEDGERGGDNSGDPVGSSPSWCVCGKCREMDRNIECVCCNKRNCIAKYEDFFHTCIDHFQLTIAILDWSDTRADPVDYSPASYRKAAYRRFILYHNGYLGRGNRKVIPSCVVLEIRHWYLSPSGVYMRFREY